MTFLELTLEANNTSAQRWLEWILAEDQTNAIDMTATLASAAPHQAWFWSPGWQAMEAEAERDLREGRYEIFDSDEEFLASLE